MGGLANGAASDKPYGGFSLHWETQRISPLEGKQSRALIQLFEQKSRVAFPKPPGMCELCIRVQTQRNITPKFPCNSSANPKRTRVPHSQGFSQKTGSFWIKNEMCLKHFTAQVKLGAFSAADWVKFITFEHLAHLCLTENPHKCFPASSHP